MARTRSLKAAPSKALGSKGSSETDASNDRPKLELVSTAGEPPKVFILPSQITPEARIVTLPHPRHSQPSRYLICPGTGIYEFTKISAPKATPRSWLLEAAAGSDTGSEVTMGSDLFVATSIDPLFLVLPVLFETNTTKGSEERERLFRQSDDLFEKLPQEDSHMSEVLRWPATRSLLEARMEVVCDTIEAGGETMFRLDEKKLLQVLLDKAKRMSRDGLPATLEERFVKRALEAPLALKKSEMADIKIETGDSDSDAVIMKTDSGISQSTLSTTGTNESSVSQLSTAATSISDEASGETLVSAMEASPEVTQLQRLRIAFDFICSTYVNTALASHLKQSLKNTEADAVDFSALDDYLARLETLRSETMATTTTADFSRRRRRDEEEEDERQEKKRKMEEAKKKKASESRALRDLKKVDTSGMKKLSAFFKKK